MDSFFRQVRQVFSTLCQFERNEAISLLIVQEISFQEPIPWLLIPISYILYYTLSLFVKVFAISKKPRTLFLLDWVYLGFGKGIWFI